MTLVGALSRIDFTDLDNFANGFPHDLFAVHRRVAPVFWHEPTEHTLDGEGFWSVASYAETLAVLRDPVVFSSVTGGERPFGGTLLQDLAIAGQVLNMVTSLTAGAASFFSRRLSVKGQSGPQDVACGVFVCRCAVGAALTGEFRLSDAVLGYCVTAELTAIRSVPGAASRRACLW